MGRPPLPVGTHGQIRCYQTANGWRAVTDFRDFDGKTRRVERNGSSQAAAKRKLKEGLRDRATPSGGDGLTPDSRFRKAADLWLAEFEIAVTVDRALCGAACLPGSPAHAETGRRPHAPRAPWAAIRGLGRSGAVRRRLEEEKKV